MLFAEVETGAITLGAAFATMVALVVWIVKVAAPTILAQYRTDVFEMQKSGQQALKEAIAEFRAENRLRDERFDKELARRDLSLEKLTVVVDRLADQVQELKDQTGEHPIPRGSP